MEKTAPVLVSNLFPALLDELLRLLTGLTAEEWEQPTICVPWTVKDLSMHLLADDVGILARRDKYTNRTGQPITSWDDVLTLVNTQNRVWVEATRRVSPPLVCDFLRLTGQQVSEYFKSLDPFVMGNPVDWVSPDPAPVWLDIAREFTERWHHQQQLREAVNKPDLDDPVYLRPVLATFVHALKRTYRDVLAPEQTVITLHISGEAGGSWSLVRENRQWELYLGANQEATAEVTLPQDVAWRLFTKGITSEQAQEQATLKGDEALSLKLLETVSIIA